MWRRTVLGRVATSKPATVTCPDVGCASVQSMLIVVDLPAPFGPRNANTSPSCTSKLMASAAVKSPKRLVRSRTSTTLGRDAATGTSGSATCVEALGAYSICAASLVDSTGAEDISGVHEDLDLGVLVV